MLLAALHCSRCLSINRNLTGPRWHFVIWSWRISLNASHLCGLICSPLLSNIHHNLIYTCKTYPFSWWDGYILLAWTGFICLTLLMAIHKHTFSLSKCKGLLFITKKKHLPGIKHNSTALWIKEECSFLPSYLHGTLIQSSCWLRGRQS